MSADSWWTHAAYAARLSLRFPLLSDYERQVAQGYVGAYDSAGGHRVVNKRGVVVVAPDDAGSGPGRVAWSWITEDPAEVPNTEEVRMAVQDLADG